MIEHIALFKFKANLSVEEREHLIAQIASLRERVPDIKGFEVRRDILRSPQSYDLGLFVSFDNMESLLQYGSHPERVGTGAKAQELCTSIIIFDYETP